MHHAQIACVEPTACKRFIGGFRIFQIAFHHDVAAEHQFAYGDAIVWHGFHADGVAHAQAVLQIRAHTLAGIQGGAG